MADDRHNEHENVQERSVSKEVESKKALKQPAASTSELLASAKVLAKAAKSGFGGSEKENMDKAKLADAATDLLGAASHYGKLEEKSYGKYVQQAENYLHKYGDSSNIDHNKSSKHEGSDRDHKSGRVGGDDDHDSKKNSHVCGGGYGDYVKMAQGFLGSDDKKSSKH